MLSEAALCRRRPMKSGLAACNNISDKCIILFLALIFCCIFMMFVLMLGQKIVGENGLVFGKAKVPPLVFQGKPRQISDCTNVFLIIFVFNWVIVSYRNHDDECYRIKKITGLWSSVKSRLQHFTSFV